MVTAVKSSPGTSRPFTRECPDCRAQHRTVWLYIQDRGSIRFVGGNNHYHVDFDKRQVGVTCDRCGHEFLWGIDN